MSAQPQIIVAGGFDDLKSRDLRFLEEAAKLGDLTVLLWTDQAIEQHTGKAPKFPMAERNYFLNAVRYVKRVVEAEGSAGLDALPKNVSANVWADIENPANAVRQKLAAQNQITYRVFSAAELSGFPDPPPLPLIPCRKKVVVTGSFDWFHSGHVRFLEEVSTHGYLFVVVGHDANIRLLKGEGHPLLSEAERRYVVGSIRFVKQALISSGDGWLDADPEIRRLQPDIYAVNEDGDKGGKREYCAKLGIEYLVLKRVPAPGLPKRSSTDLRGF
jgi:cytidyltransferase-like protein